LIVGLLNCHCEGSKTIKQFINSTIFRLLTKKWSLGFVGSKERKIAHFCSVFGGRLLMAESAT
jgi:hypothetical protein